MISINKVKRYYKASRYQLQKLSKTILYSSLPFFIANAFLFINLKIDQIFIYYFINDKAVGIYALASRFSEFYYFVPNAIVISIFPSIVNMLKKTSKKFYLKFKMFTTALFYVGFIVSLILFLSSEFLIGFLLDKSYESSAFILKIQVISIPFVSIGFLMTKTLIARHQVKSYLINKITAGLLNIIGNLIFIPIFGIVAAAFVTLFSYFWGYFLGYAFIKSSRDLFWQQVKGIVKPTFKLF